ncbi:Sorting nexin-12 [Grifola frondosa]|uniref:Sorting nexin-12 n=1 Tax=Grifola frondosa TaxID=5627 RepID=A0A1C7MR01_GRIFR|nr:Sorting nexin-12 [Grifola frondosa]
MSPVRDVPSASTSRAPLFDEPDDADLQRIAEQSRRMEAIQAALTDIIALDRQHEEPPSGSSSDSLSIQDPSLRASRSTDSAKRRLAGPGDLHLSHEIERLANKIGTIMTQDAMLDTLIKKAELTGTRRTCGCSAGPTGEREPAAVRPYEGRDRQLDGGEEDGRSVVRYLIEVQQLAQDGSFTSGWVVARRYNEFFNMQTSSCEIGTSSCGIGLPWETPGDVAFGEFRGLKANRSREVSAELDSHSCYPSSSSSKAHATGSAFPGHGLVRTMYQSVAESIDDMFFGPSMLDVIIQRLTTQAAEFAGITGTGIHDEDLVAQALKASGKSTSEDTLLQLSGDLKPLEGETSSSTFSSPICDFILAVFELDKKNNWLRRQAIVIILQQVFGGTIERKLRETVKSLLDEPHLMVFVNMFRDGLWPGGQLKSPEAPRTAEERLHTRDEANRKLSALMPDLAANMIGRSNARRGARRIFAVLQNRRLNQHIVYTIVDEVFAALFSEG